MEIHLPGGRSLTADHLSSRQTLRGALGAPWARSSTRWMSLRGLGADTRDHAALLGFVGKTENAPSSLPEPGGLVVLDWHVLSSITADALALAVVICGRLRARGIRLVACAPSERSVGAVLDPAIACGSFPDVHWIPGERAGRVTCRLLPPLIDLGRTSDIARARAAVPAIESAVEEAGASPEGVDRISNLVVELVANVGTHARADHAMLVVLTHPHRRPAVAEVGVADDGIGMVSSLVESPAHADLAERSDGFAVRVLLHQRLSRRPEGMGGGLARLIGDLAGVRGADALIRTESGRARLRSPEIERFTSGWGTQLRLTVPLHP